jgi:DNA-binding phage protein
MGIRDILRDKMTHTKTFTASDLVAPGRHIQERNRALALSYLSLGGKRGGVKRQRGVVKQLADQTGITPRTIHRALQRELAWAMTQVPTQRHDLPTDSPTA